MAPVKRRPRPRSHHKMKVRRSKPNFLELLLKSVGIPENRGRGRSSHSCEGNCHYCNQQKRRVEVVDSADTQRAPAGRSMAKKQRKDAIRSPKSRGVTNHRNAGVREVKKYIQKALDFAVESGYLIPKDPKRRLLRVSSELMSGVGHKNAVRTLERTVSQERDRSPHRMPPRFEGDEVQEAGRRRRRRSRRRGRRSRSRSRSGSKRRRRSRRRRGGRSRSQNQEEVVEAAEYATDNNEDEKRDDQSVDADEDPESARLNPADGEKDGVKGEEDGSDLSANEDESDDEEEKKGDNADK